jgi:hypothetical protein
MAAGRPWEGDRGTTEMHFEAEFNGDDESLTQRDWDDAHLINAALDIHADDPAFGYGFIADELPARSILAGENKVARLCSQERIWSIFAKKRGLNRRPDPRSTTTSSTASSAQRGSTTCKHARG